MVFNGVPSELVTLLRFDGGSFAGEGLGFEVGFLGAGDAKKHDGEKGVVDGDRFLDWGVCG